FYKPGLKGKCKSRVSRLSLLEKAVWESVKCRLQDEKLVRKQLEFALAGVPKDDVIDSIAACHATLEKIEKGQQRLVKTLMAASDETAEIIERELHTLSEKRKGIQKELELLNAKQRLINNRKINIEWVLNNLHVIAQGLEKFTFDERRTLIE